jgi:putative flippase GtrA
MIDTVQTDDASQTSPQIMTGKVTVNTASAWRLVWCAVRGRFGGYALVGAAGTLLHWLLYAALVMAAVAPVIATTVGAVAGACLNYWLNRRLVFRTRDQPLRRLARFMAVAGIGMLINTFVVGLLHGINVWLAQLCATALVLLSGYWMNARWTFGDSASANAERQI